MKKILLALITGMVAASFHAQINYGGQPLQWENKSIGQDIPTVITETPDYDRIVLEDAITDQYKDVPYRFGIEYEVNLNLDNSGRWIELDGKRIWQLAISSPGALNMSLRFDSFNIPKGGELFIWSADREEYLGKYDYRNMNEKGILATSLIHGDKIVVEYSIPTEITKPSQLKIGQIVHGYRPFLKSRFFDEASVQRGPFGSSGSCNNNVNCPVGADWEVEKKSVAIIVEGGFGMCTGALVNNTNNDGTPYFLTANHCTQGANVGNWVFYFNHESLSCNGTTGPTSQSISGSSLVANNGGSDFALLLLDDTPPASFNVQYAGWDASDDENAVSSAVCIHHPSGDIKKISVEEDAPYHDMGNGAQVWWIDDWEDGVTEPGSSGSPLFNQDHRIIGQLFGGASACNGSNGNGQYDFYGRFGVSWDNSNNAASRLKDWLDPGNTGISVLDGFPEGFEVLASDPGINSITGIAANMCSTEINGQFSLLNAGSTTLTSCTINYQLNSGITQTIDWTGSLAQNQSTIISLPTITAQSGANTLTIWVTNPSSGNDENLSNNQVTLNFNAASSSASYGFTLEIVLDNYPQEVSWDITNTQGNILYDSDGTYANEDDGATVIIEGCLPSGCYDLNMYDSEGDGICCFFGEGSYTLTNSDNDVLAEGGNYDEEETTEFCLGQSYVQYSNPNEVRIYPNPANAGILISAITNMTDLEIYDVAGKLVLSQQPNSTHLYLDLTNLPDGVYQLLTTIEKGQKSTRLVIRH